MKTVKEVFQVIRALFAIIMTVLFMIPYAISIILNWLSIIFKAVATIPFGKKEVIRELEKIKL